MRSRGRWRIPSPSRLGAHKGGPMLQPRPAVRTRVLSSLLLSLAASTAAWARAADASAVTVVRDAEPVNVLGASLADLTGRSIAELALFRYDAASASFV